MSTSTSSPAMQSLTMPALGENIQLGGLYNYKTTTFYSGASPWDSNVANPTVDTPPDVVQNAEYKLFTSLDEARKHVDLGAEGSLGLDIGILQAKGSAAYLNKKKSTAYEARVDVSCTIVRRTRCIPQQTLVKMQYPERLDNNDFTHFVAEVVEGGTATLTFVQSCDTLEEMKKVQGDLEVTLKGVNFISGGANIQLQNADAIKKERLSISYSGALAVQIATLEDAIGVARDMPAKLQSQMNTLSCKLQLVYLLGNEYSRQINYLDSELLKQASDALRIGESTLLELRHIYVTLNNFTMIAPQIHNMINAVDAATRKFSSKLRKLLPELRDALVDTTAKKNELQSAVKLYHFQMEAASKYLIEKRGEARDLNSIVEELCKHGFVDELNGAMTYSHPLGRPPTLLLSLGGEYVINPLHPLQQHVELRQLDEDDTNKSLDEDGTKVSLDEDDRVRVHESYEKLKSLKGRLRELGAEAPTVAFAVANISKVQRGGSKSGSKYVSTAPGDVVLGHKGRLVIVTGMLPGDAALSPPTLSTISYDHVVVDVPMNHYGGSEPEPINALTPTKIHVHYRRHGDSLWTDMASLEWSPDARQLRVSPLLPEIEYEIQMRILTRLGPTCWSTSTVVETTKALQHDLAENVANRGLLIATTLQDLEKQPSTIVSIRNNASGNVLDHYRNRMIMATFNNESHPNHFWRRTHLQDGSVVYKNVASNMALSHSRDASVHAIKSLQLSDWHCQWMEQGVGDGFVAIRNRATGMVLDHFGGYTITAFHDDVNCKNRQWMVSTIKSSAAHSPSSMVVIKNRATGKVLDHFYGKSIQAPNSDESHPNHQWRRTQLSDGFVVYTNVASDMTLAHGPVDLVCAVKTLDLHCQWEELDVGSGAVAIRNKATGMVLNHLHGIPIIALDDSLSPSSQQWTIRTLA